MTPVRLRTACLLLAILAASCGGGNDASCPDGAGDANVDAAQDADTATPSGALDAPVGVSDLDAAAIDPMDRERCQQLCNVSAMVGCGDAIKCLPACVETLATTRCLAERRALVTCEADGGVASLVCVDGLTFELPSYCASEADVLFSCETDGR